MYDRQPQPAALAFRRIERIEDPGSLLLGHSTPVIGNFQSQVLAVAQPVYAFKV
jgi:hypothetical protein